MPKSSRSLRRIVHVREESPKVLGSLVGHVYYQTSAAMITSIFCALIIFVGLFRFREDNSSLYTWLGIYFAIFIGRMVVFILYRTHRYLVKTKTWRDLYILCAFFGGLSWGAVGILLFPDATAVQQTLVLLVIVGFAGGVVPLSAAVPLAGILFLLASIVPLMLAILQVDNKAYFLFDIAIPVYLVYNIILMLKTYSMIKKSVILKYENDILLNNLSASNKKLSHAATRDPLTHVANRRFFEKTVTQAIRDAREQKTKLTLFYLDLDNFKDINDQYGHHAGDHALLVVIARLKNFFRKQDVIARIGGDELAVIVEHTNGEAEVKSIANRICQLVSAPIDYNQIKFTITTSVGIAVYPDDGENENALLNCADKRMYAAKNQGGNYYYFDVPTSPMSPKQASAENKGLGE